MGHGRNVYYTRVHTIQYKLWYNKYDCYFVLGEADLMKKLSALPLRMDTFRLRTEKQELEGKLAKIDEGKKIFSRPKVFVKIDS